MTAIEWLEKELIKRFKRNQLHYTDSEWCFDMIKKLSKQAMEVEKQQQEEFAIGFARWYEFTLRESDNLNERFTPKQLIEMFKKEKGL